MEERILALLGAGITPSVVAASLGVSESRISQLLATEEFSSKVAQLRYDSLQKHNVRDASYDSLEDALIEKMRDCIPLMHRPMEILKAISVINSAKRRGASSPDSIIEKQQVISLQIPVQVINKFQTNLQGQVTEISTESTKQSLLTIQSSALESLVKEKRNESTEPAGSLLTA